MEIISRAILDSQHLDWVWRRGFQGLESNSSHSPLGNLATPLGQYLQITLDFYHHSVLPLATILAQVIEDPDIIGQMQDAWNNFIETGQVWALLIGVFFGYLFKGLTSY